MEHARPVTMAVRPVPSIPWVTSSAVEEDENPDGSNFLWKGHILSMCSSKIPFKFLSLQTSSWQLEGQTQMHEKNNDSEMAAKKSSFIFYFNNLFF